MTFVPWGGLGLKKQDPKTGVELVLYRFGERIFGRCESSWQNFSNAKRQIQEDQDPCKYYVVRIARRKTCLTSVGDALAHQASRQGPRATPVRPRTVPAAGMRHTALRSVNTCAGRAAYPARLKVVSKKGAVRALGKLAARRCRLTARFHDVL